MVGSDMRERSRRASRSAGPMFDLVAAKLLRPLVRADTIRRSLLIDRLAREARPIVSVVAPAGYGKTTLLAQWAEHNGQAFAWVSVDEADNDPKVLLTYVAEALDVIEPVSGRVFEALASRGSSVPGSVVPRLGGAFASMRSPVALVLDDVHLLHDRQCRAALSVLADHVPGGSHLVLSGRERPPLQVARPRPWPDRPAPCCAGAGLRAPSPARCRRGWPCTGEMSRQRAGNSSAPSLCGPC
jgi:LuxR family transcriptional regulator, maltose regulon positive regulatory protein